MKFHVTTGKSVRLRALRLAHTGRNAHATSRSGSSMGVLAGLVASAFRLDPVLGTARRRARPVRSCYLKSAHKPYKTALTRANRMLYWAQGSQFQNGKTMSSSEGRCRCPDFALSVR